jgi:hypothetical protein
MYQVSADKAKEHLSARSLILMSEDFDAPLEDFEEYMR